MAHSDRRDPATQHLKLIVRVLQDLVRQGSYTRYADLLEDAKARCARLRIAYDTATIFAALDRLEQGGQRRILQVPSPAPAAVEPTERPVSRDEAAAVLTRIRRQLGVAAGPRRMPRARVIPPHNTARAKALAFVMDEIRSAEARCDVLEATAGDRELVGARR